MRCEFPYSKLELVNSSYVNKRRGRRTNAPLPMPKVELTHRRSHGGLEWCINNLHLLYNPVAEDLLAKKENIMARQGQKE